MMLILIFYNILLLIYYICILLANFRYNGRTTYISILLWYYSNRKLLYITNYYDTDNTAVFLTEMDGKKLASTIIGNGSVAKNMWQHSETLFTASVTQNMSPSESAVDSQNSIFQTATQLTIHTLLFRDFITSSGPQNGRQTVNNVNKYPQTLQYHRRKMSFRVL